jgi:hypothetical protein
MNTNSNGWGAFMNQKKENEVLKQQQIIDKAKQSGIILSVNDNGNFNNAEAVESPFRMPNTNTNTNTIIKDKELDKEKELDDAEAQILNEIIALQEQLAFSKEVKRKKELFKETQNKKIQELNAEMEAKTLQYNMEMDYIRSQIAELKEKIENIDINKIMNEINDNDLETALVNMTNNKAINEKDSNEKETNNKLNNKKVRTIIKRKPLYEVIKQPTQFKTMVKGTEFRCYTQDGHKIITIDTSNNSNSKTYNSLNVWLEQSILTMCEKNTTKKSVYEVVSYYNNSKKEWRPLKTDYTSDTVCLN